MLRRSRPLQVIDTVIQSGIDVAEDAINAKVLLSGLLQRASRGSGYALLRRFLHLRSLLTASKTFYTVEGHSLVIAFLLYLQ